MHWDWKLNVSCRVALSILPMTKIAVYSHACIFTLPHSPNYFPFFKNYFSKFDFYYYNSIKQKNIEIPLKFVFNGKGPAYFTTCLSFNFVFKM